MIKQENQSKAQNPADKLISILNIVDINFECIGCDKQDSSFIQKLAKRIKYKSQNQKINILKRGNEGQISLNNFTSSFQNFNNEDEIFLENFPIEISNDNSETFSKSCKNNNQENIFPQFLENIKKNEKNSSKQFNNIVSDKKNYRLLQKRTYEDSNLNLKKSSFLNSNLKVQFSPEKSLFTISNNVQKNNSTTDQISVKNTYFSPFSLFKNQEHHLNNNFSNCKALEEKENLISSQFKPKTNMKIKYSPNECFLDLNLYDNESSQLFKSSELSLNLQKKSEYDSKHLITPLKKKNKSNSKIFTMSNKSSPDSKNQINGMIKPKKLFLTSKKFSFGKNMKDFEMKQNSDYKKIILNDYHNDFFA